MKCNPKTCLNKNTQCSQGSHSALCHQGSCFLPGCVRKPPGSLYVALGGTYFTPGHCICRNTLSSVTGLSWVRAAAVVGCVCPVSAVVSDSLRLFGLQPARLLCLWDSPGKNTGAGSHSLSGGSAHPRDRIRVSCIGRRIPYC